jgi:hypothetical protein
MVKFAQRKVPPAASRLQPCMRWEGAFFYQRGVWYGLMYECVDGRVAVAVQGKGRRE